jgi:hypothetical protein
MDENLLQRMCFTGERNEKTGRLEKKQRRLLLTGLVGWSPRADNMQGG